MKNIFFITLLALVAFSQAIQMRSGFGAKTANGLPILYWATNISPTRERTARLFRAWLKAHGYPDMEVRLDANNSSLQKLLIQGVSGVGPDVFNCFGWDMQYLHQIGLVAELDELMKEFPFPSENHDPAVSNDLFVAGKRIAFSQNAGTSYYFVNLGYLRGIGMPPPPTSWTADAFESYGRVFAVKANQNRTDRLRSFLVNGLDQETFRRSAGISVFNETLSACTLNHPGHAALLQRLRRWTTEDKIIPTASDMSAYSVEEGWGTGNFTQLFQKGYIALMWSGLPMLIWLRELKPTVDMGIAECPSIHFPNSVSRTFSTALYPGSKNAKLAAYFLLYLTSESHNMEIAEDGDQMPPIPSYRTRDAFLKPAAWPNEWEAHRIYVEKSSTLSIGSEYSPYVPYSPYMKETVDAWNGYESGRWTAEEACGRMEKKINRLIERSVAHDPVLRSRHEKARLVQNQIDALKENGRKIPADLIDNPFLKKYWRAMGKLEE